MFIIKVCEAGIKSVETTTGKKNYFAITQLPTLAEDYHEKFWKPHHIAWLVNWSWENGGAINADLMRVPCEKFQLQYWLFSILCYGFEFFKKEYIMIVLIVYFIIIGRKLNKFQ